MKKVLERFGNFCVRMLLAAGGMVGIFSMLGYFGANNWVLDLFCHFRVQYVLILVLLILIFSFSKEHRVRTLMFTCFVLANLVELAPYFVPAAHESAQQKLKSGANLKMMQMNIWAHRENYPKILKRIEAEKPDIISFQELTNRSKGVFDRELATSYPYRAFVPRDDCFGIGFASRIPLENVETLYVIENGVECISPPMVAAKIKWQGRQISIISVHTLPPLSEHSFETVDKAMVARLIQFCKENKEVILIGDLNCSRHSYLFKSLIKGTGLKDSMDGRGWQPSYPSFLPALMIPIDHCLVSPDIRVIRRRTAASCDSDHLPMVVELR